MGPGPSGAAAKFLDLASPTPSFPFAVHFVGEFIGGRVNVPAIIRVGNLFQKSPTARAARDEYLRHGERATFVALLRCTVGAIEQTIKQN